MPLSDDVFTISENVLSAMLQFDVLHSPASKLPANELITGCVQISGEWTGAVLLQTSLNFATQAAANLLAMQIEDVQYEDREDAMAELANMIGGQIKGILPGPAYLSLPTVALVLGQNFKLFGTAVECHVPMLCQDEAFHVTVAKSSLKPTPILQPVGASPS